MVVIFVSQVMVMITLVVMEDYKNNITKTRTEGKKNTNGSSKTLMVKDKNENKNKNEDKERKGTQMTPGRRQRSTESKKWMKEARKG